MLNLNADCLVYLFSFLSTADILALRRTCKRLSAISCLRSVWHTACTTQILEHNHPFPQAYLPSSDASALEYLAVRASRVGRSWLSNNLDPRIVCTFEANPSVPISEVYFLPSARPEEVRLATISKGIWSDVTCWSVLAHPRGNTNVRKLATWTMPGAIITGSAVCDINRADEKVKIAVSVSRDSETGVHVLSLESGPGSTGHELVTMHEIQSTFRPMLLRGDIIALSDDFGRTTIMNWKTGSSCHLCSANNDIDGTRIDSYNRCHQVLFAHASILVVRARSIALFSLPNLDLFQSSETLHPVAEHSFGWLDGISAALSSPTPSAPHGPIHLLLRARQDDPWQSSAPLICHYILPPHTESPTPPHLDPDADDGTDHAVQYLFPPLLLAEHPSTPGTLRCPTLNVGRCGTALLVRPAPAPATMGGLTAFDVHASETQTPEGPAARGEEQLVGMVLQAGGVWEARVLHEGEGEHERDGEGEGAGMDAREEEGVLWRNERKNWTSLAYDEEMGRVALGDALGRVTILEI